MIKQIINGKEVIWGEKDTKEWIDKFVKRKIKQFHPIAQKIVEDKILMGAWSTKELEKFIRSIIKAIKK